MLLSLCDGEEHATMGNRVFMTRFRDKDIV